MVSDLLLPSNLSADTMEAPLPMRIHFASSFTGFSKNKRDDNESILVGFTDAVIFFINVDP